MTTTTATIKGQVTIPRWVREKLHIRQGTKQQEPDCLPPEDLVL